MLRVITELKQRRYTRRRLRRSGTSEEHTIIVNDPFECGRSGCSVGKRRIGIVHKKPDSEDSATGVALDTSTYDDL